MPALLMPNVGEGVTEGTVVRWLKHEGERVALDEPLVEVETDKALVEVPSPVAGVLARVLVAEGGRASIGAPLAEFETDGLRATPTQPGPAGAETAPAGEPPVGSSARDMRRQGRYSPVVLRLAAEHDIDLAAMEGSGIGGRVTRADITRYLEQRALEAAPAPAGAAPAGSAVAAAAPTAEPERAPASEVVPLSPLRRTIAERMMESHEAIPVAWMAVEADVTGLVALRRQMLEEFQAREGVHLTYLPFLVEAIVAALQDHPGLNATFSDDAVTLHHRYDIGIAVSTAHGLMVPVLRGADRKSLGELAREIARLADESRSRRIPLSELRGSTFTVNNTGAFGSVISQPIILPGQVAIITTEAVRRVLRVMDDDRFAVRSVMNLAISFDHRALDGGDVGPFMRDVRERIEAIRPAAS